MTIRGWFATGVPFVVAIGLAYSHAAPPAAAASSAAGEAQTARPRNIVFILVDDLRYDGMGFLQPEVKTPNIDTPGAGRHLFPQHGGHLVAVLAQPGDHPDRRDDAQPPGRGQQQLVRGGARLLPELPAEGGIPDGVLRQVAHGGEQRRAAAGVRQVGELPGPGRVLPGPGDDAQRGRPPRSPEGLHHRRADRLRDGLAPEGARSREALLPLPEPQGGAYRAAAGAAPRASVRRHAFQDPGERREHARELQGQAHVGLQPAQHLARHRLLLPLRHEDDGLPEGLLRDALRRRREPRTDPRVPEEERPRGRHDDRVHVRQRLPDRRPRAHRQAQRLRGFGAHPDGGLRAGPGAGGGDEPGPHPQAWTSPPRSSTWPRSPCRRSSRARAPCR